MSAACRVTRVLMQGYAQDLYTGMEGVFKIGMGKRNGLIEPRVLASARQSSLDLSPMKKPESVVFPELDVEDLKSHIDFFTGRTREETRHNCTALTRSMQSPPSHPINRLLTMDAPPPPPPSTSSAPRLSPRWLEIED
jgi:hypothetical protein